MAKNNNRTSLLLPFLSSTTPLLLLILTLAVGLCRGSISRCPESYYRPRGSSRCRPCSTCPDNQIIRQPCTEHTNTLCGPFSEFLEFQQAPRPGLSVEDFPEDAGGKNPDDLGVPDTRGSDDNRSKKLRNDDEVIHNSDDDEVLSKHKNAKWHRHRKGDKPGSSQDNQHHHTSGDSAVVGGEGERRRGGGGGVSRDRGDHHTTSFQDSEEGARQWKVLAVALIVVLCIVCLFLIVFVFVICYMRSRRAQLKQVLYSAADKGPGSRAPGHRPHQAMHYVPVLTHAQVRAGTSGAAMTVAVPGNSSYLYSEDYDADHSGQTVSTTKSSDYVYFKSPHNGNNVYDV